MEAEVSLPFPYQVMPSAKKYSAVEAGHHWDPGEVSLATKEARLEGQRGSCRCMSWGAP